MKILIAEPNEQVRDLMGFYLETEFQIEAILTHSIETAKAAMSSAIDLDCLISAATFGTGTSRELFDHALKVKPGIRLVLCTSEENQTPSPSLEYLPSPWDLENLNTLITRLVGKTKPPEYCKIRISTALKFGMMSGNLFIKLSDDRYIKVLHQTDVFDIEDYNRFDSKKVEFVYLEAADGKRFAEKLSQNITSLLEVKALPTSDSLQISSETLEVISELNSQMGFTPEIQELAKVSINIALKNILATPALASLMDVAMKDPTDYLASHSVTLAYLSCGIAFLMGWASESTFHKLALAAFLHDITLKDSRLAQIQSKDDPQWAKLVDDSPKDLQKLTAHPNDAALLLDKMKEIPPDAASIIQQHHERPDGTGFPRKLSHLQITPLASVFIVAHELLSFRLKNKNNKELHAFVVAYDVRFSKGHFRKVMNALNFSR